MQIGHFNLKWNSVGIKPGQWQKEIQIHSGGTISSPFLKNSSDRDPRTKSSQTKITTRKISQNESKYAGRSGGSREKSHVGKIFCFIICFTQ